MKSLPLQLAVSVSGAAVLVWLGLWQLDRAVWKDGVIAVMEARLAETPVALPDAPMAEADAFRAVRVTGRIAGEGVPVFSTWRGGGAGYRPVVPFETDDGRRVLLDPGVAPGEAVSFPSERIAVEGNLHWPSEVQRDTDAPVWGARDVPALAARLGTEPVLIVARATSLPAGPVRPVPVSADGIADNHFGYAVQWFGLALVWSAMSALFFWRRLRRSEV